MHVQYATKGVTRTDGDDVWKKESVGDCLSSDKASMTYKSQ